MLLPDYVLSAVLDVMKKGGKAEGDDWLKILGALRSELMLQDHLMTFANTPLRNVKLRSKNANDSNMENIDENRTIGSALSNTREKPTNFPLSTPGFWYHLPWCPNITIAKDSDFGTWNIWGLTRKGDWALVQLSVHRYKPGDQSYWHCYRILDMVRASNSDPVEICMACKESFRGIWNSLCSAIQNWAEKRRKIAQSATAFETGIKSINEIVEKFAR